MVTKEYEDALSQLRNETERLHVNRYKISTFAVEMLNDIVSLYADSLSDEMVEAKLRNAITEVLNGDN